MKGQFFTTPKQMFAIFNRQLTFFDWENAFLNTDVDAQVSIFSNTVLNILNNYIPHETKICDDRDRL